MKLYTEKKLGSIYESHLQALLNFIIAKILHDVKIKTLPKNVTIVKFFTVIPEA